MQVFYIIVKGDIFWLLFVIEYGGLIRYQVMMVLNLFKDVYNFIIGDIIMVLIFCVCLIVVQVVNGMNYLVMIIVYFFEMFDIISVWFGILMIDFSRVNNVNLLLILDVNIILFVLFVILLLLVIMDWVLVIFQFLLSLFVIVVLLNVVFVVIMKLVLQILFYIGIVVGVFGLILVVVFVLLFLFKVF